MKHYLLCENVDQAIGSVVNAAQIVKCHTDKPNCPKRIAAKLRKAHALLEEVWELLGDEADQYEADKSGCDSAEKENAQ